MRPETRRRSKNLCPGTGQFICFRTGHIYLFTTSNRGYQLEVDFCNFMIRPGAASARRALHDAARYRRGAREAQCAQL